MDHEAEQVAPGLLLIVQVTHEPRLNSGMIMINIHYYGHDHSQQS